MRIIYSLIKTLIFFCIIGAFGLHIWQLPSRNTPWGEVDLNDEIGVFTAYKIGALKDRPETCFNLLEKTSVTFDRLPEKQEGACFLPPRVHLERTLYPYSAPLRPACALAAALIVWEREILTKAADKHLNSNIARINHYGIFSCRNIAGSRRRSQHAFANAIDIGGFTLKNGQIISIRKDWPKDSAENAFLKEIHKGACTLFKGVLGPDYNAAHADHFHFDMGPYSICR